MLKTHANRLDDRDVIHMRLMLKIGPENHPQAAHSQSTAYPQKNVNKWENGAPHVLCKPIYCGLIFFFRMSMVF